MPTFFVKGDLFADPGQGEDKHAFAFAAPTTGTLDAGVAVAFAKRYPGLLQALKARAVQGELAMGEVFTWEKDGTTVFVLALLRKAKPAKVSDVTKALEAMVAKAQAAGVTRIALARLGGGKTDLDPLRVKRVLDDVGGASSVMLVVYQQFIRGVVADLFGAAPPAAPSSAVGGEDDDVDGDAEEGDADEMGGDDGDMEDVLAGYGETGTQARAAPQRTTRRTKAAKKRAVKAGTRIADAGPARGSAKPAAKKAVAKKSVAKKSVAKPAKKSAPPKGGRPGGERSSGGPARGGASRGGPGKKSGPKGR